MLHGVCGLKCSLKFMQPYFQKEDYCLIWLGFDWLDIQEFQELQFQVVAQSHLLSDLSQKHMALLFFTTVHFEMSYNYWELRFVDILYTHRHYIPLTQYPSLPKLYSTKRKTLTKFCVINFSVLAFCPHPNTTAWSLLIQLPFFFSLYIPFEHVVWLIWFWR